MSYEMLWNSKKTKGKKKCVKLLKEYIQQQMLRKDEDATELAYLAIWNELN